jgi:hypothetical protein
MTPADANRREVPATGSEAVDVYGFYWYHGGPAITWAGGWPTVDTWPGGLGTPVPGSSAAYTGLMWDHGIAGSADVGGWAGSGGDLYHVKVWAFDARGPNGNYETGQLNNDDWQMYGMGWPLESIDLPWGGAVELYVAMNCMAKLRGTVTWLDQFGTLRPLPWAQVTASPGPSTDSTPAYTAGFGFVSPWSAGDYVMWLPAGTHDVSVSTSEAPGTWASGAPTQNAQFSVVVYDGWVGGGDARLGQSGVPVPEVPIYMVPLALFAALAASVWLLRRRTFNIPVLIK